MVGRKMCLLEWWEERESSGGLEICTVSSGWPIENATGQ